MDKQKLNLIAAGVLTVLSLNVNAALNIYSNEVEKAEDARNLGNYEFNQKGLSAEETQVVSGFGKDMPLSLSLQIIVPNDWKVDLNEAAQNMLVNWMGKSSWPYVLENLAQDHNLLVTVDWEKRVVNVFSKEAEERLIAKKQEEMKVAEAKREELTKEAEKVAKQAEKVRQQVVVEQKRVAAENVKLAKARDYAALEQKILKEFVKENPGTKPTVNQLFTEANVHPLDRTEESFVKMRANKTLQEHQEAWYYLKEETMLSENIIAWGKANGWRVIWSAESDFRIVDRIELKGTLTNNVNDIISLYRNSDKPLMVNMYIKNKVISVRDFNYDKK